MNKETTRPYVIREDAELTGLYTVREAAKLTGKSIAAIRKRVDRGTLGSISGRRRGRGYARLISSAALVRAGLLGDYGPTTLADDHIWGLIGVLRGDPGQPYTTFDLRRRSRTIEGGSTGGRRGSIPAPRMGPMMPRQMCEVALRTLRALGLVTLSVEPPPSGSGRPRNVWRWKEPNG